jgi:short-subunit dehydrogenase
MQEFGGGSIINFSSVAGIQPAAFIEPAPAPHRA